MMMLPRFSVFAIRCDGHLVHAGRQRDRRGRGSVGVDARGRRDRGTRLGLQHVAQDRAAEVSGGAVVLLRHLGRERHGAGRLRAAQDLHRGVLRQDREGRLGAEVAVVPVVSHGDGLGAEAVGERVDENPTESFRRAQSRTAQPGPEVSARFHRKVGHALLIKGAYPEAPAAFAEGLAVLDGAGHPEAARIGLEIGQLHWRGGDFLAAQAAFSTSVDIAQRLGVEEVLAECLRELGNIPLHAGDAREAVQFFEQSRAIDERLEDLPGIANVRTNLGTAYVRMGRWDEALAELQSALALQERMGNLRIVGMLHNNVGEAHRLRGHFRDEAIAAFERALAIWDKIGHAPGVALALTGLGGARVEAGEVEEGRANLLDAEARFNSLGRTMYFPDLYRFLASSELARGDFDAATWAAERSLEFARQAKGRLQEAMTQRVLAEIALAHGDTSAPRSKSTDTDRVRRGRRTRADRGDPRATQCTMMFPPPGEPRVFTMRYFG